MGHGRLASRIDLGHNGHADRQHRARPVATVAGNNPSAERLDKATANRKTETGPGAAPILRLDPVELVEDALEIGGRYPWPLIDNLDLDGLPVALGADIDAAASRRIFR